MSQEHSLHENDRSLRIIQGGALDGGWKVMLKQVTRWNAGGTRLYVSLKSAPGILHYVPYWLLKHTQGDVVKIHEEFAIVKKDIQRIMEGAAVLDARSCPFDRERYAVYCQIIAEGMHIDDLFPQKTPHN